MPLVTCQTCGKEFQAKPGRIAMGKAKFCSRACSAASRRATKPIPCEWCQQPMVPRRGNQKFCSRACSAAALHAAQYRKLPDQRECKQCGTGFAPATLTEHYCSNRCRKAARLGGGPSFGLFEDPWASGAIPPDRYGRDLYRTPDIGLGF
ncbi:hypothetical protein N1030_17355 [Desulfovibrio mangrovi]|uniref:hypothetical protein n=1 Tax=Desulfovibrio mangrovi TaxID=2976983 RepID=UPI00224714C8|nr:hypothetical protein [Desulfovibrio mangrovi]UZP67341.1 hypothetical protein N1030_17355 [Desulfovibrio mangrovi]